MSAPLLHQWLQAERSRPLGASQLTSGLVLQPFSRALEKAAENLLLRARVALEEGDEERTAKFVGRAAALQYDEHEDAQPAVTIASMALFNEVVDAMEDADEGDATWLTTALVVLDHVEGVAEMGLRHVLDVLSRDFTSSLSRRETKLIRREIGRPGPELDLGLTRDSSVEEIRDVVLSLLRVNLEYHMALHH